MYSLDLQLWASTSFSAFKRVVNPFLLLAALPIALQATEGVDSRPSGTKSTPARFLTAVDMQGQPIRLCAEPEIKATAVVFLTTECPICRQYVPELNRLAAEFAAADAELLGVVYDPSQTREAASAFCNEFKVEFPVIFDGSGELAAQFQPTHVPQAFVLDRDGNVVYRGRIDDLYAGVKQRRAEATTHDLRVAVESTVAGQAISVTETEAVGCKLGAIGDGPSKDVTYARDVAPIMNAHCAECHRPGEVAPFSLLSYEDTQKRADFLVDVVQSNLMPPWKAETGHVEILGERQMSNFAKSVLKTWAASGSPQGDPADLPPVPTFPEGWRLGEPDLVLRAPEPFMVPADGQDIFQHFVIPSGLLEDKNLVGFEFHPGNAAVVHHAVIFLDSQGYGRAKDAETPEPGYVTFGSIGIPTAGIVGIWTPGMTPRFFPRGMSLGVPKGADVILQLHIHPTGKEETDQSTFGLYFSEEPPVHRISRMPLLLGSMIVDIPAGEPMHVVETQITLPSDVTLVSVVPHMHLLGKEMKVTATLPDGQVKVPIWIKDWNFYWQDNYVYKEPLKLPAGTKLDIFSSYNNSSENPFNPTSPPKRVFFGNGSTDEMCFAIFQFVADEPDGLRKMERGFRNTFMREWLTAKLDEEARNHIASELMKLIGFEGDQKDFMKRMMRD